MDPTTCYEEMITAVIGNDHPRARERAISLRDWIGVGGFAPDRMTRLETLLIIRGVLGSEA